MVCLGLVVLAVGAGFGEREGSTTQLRNCECEKRDAKAHSKQRELPTVSVLLPTYSKTRGLLPFNYGQFVNFSKNYPRGKLRLSIFDKGTEPDKFIADVMKRDERVSYTLSGSIEGPPLGDQRVHLLENTTSDICMFMDGDDFYGEHYVERHVQDLTKDSQTMLVKMGAWPVLTIGDPKLEEDDPLRETSLSWQDVNFGGWTWSWMFRCKMAQKATSPCSFKAENQHEEDGVPECIQKEFGKGSIKVMNDYYFDSLKMQTKQYSNGGYSIAWPAPFTIKQLDALYYPGFLALLNTYYKGLPEAQKLYVTPEYIP